MPASPSTRELETLTVQLGNEVFDHMEGGRPTPLQMEWWEERGLQLAMHNEWLKVQAFRFIDVLPTVGNDAPEIARHLREYFVLPEKARNGHARDGARRAQQEALAELEGNSWEQGLIRLASRLMDFKRFDGWQAKLWTEIAWKSSLFMAGRFIAGTNTEEAVRAIRRMRNQNLAFTIDVLGEAAVSKSEAEAYLNTYHSLVDELPKHAAEWPGVPLVDEGDGTPIPRVNLSVKLTSINPGFDAIVPERSKDVTKDRLRPLLRKAMAAGAHAHIDIEHYAIKDLTLDLCRELFMEPEFRDYPHFGIVLQAYLKDGDQDVETIVAWAKQRGAPIWVRLVKGAYWDSETVWSQQAGWPCPVWEQKWQSDACYERMSRVLMENWRHTHGAFASHNVRSLAHAMALRRLYEVPGTAFELQMLYGMGDPIKRAFVEMNERCRIYTPYGQLLPGMAYLIRRLLENTANESFLRHTGGDTPREILLQDPEALGVETPPFEPTPIFKFEFEEPIMDPFENVPNTDFTREEYRRQMLSALAHVRGELGKEWPLIIGGERITTEKQFKTVNPSRPSDIVGRVSQAGEIDVDKAVEAAMEAFETWKYTSPHERAELVARVAQLMQERRYELAAYEVYECGKPWREADGDVSEGIDFCNYYAKEIVRLNDHARQRDIPGETNEYFYTPRGIVAVISPYNFPLALLAGMTAAAVVTGNTVVMKPASTAAVTAFKLVELFEEAGLPPGVLNYVPGPGCEVGDLLVKHPHVSMAAFTGSREVGCEIHRQAALEPTAEPGLRKVVAEMGGKNGIIIDSDADLDEAIKGVIQSAFGYAGQKCTAASRCIVLDAIHDRFVERLIEAMKTAGVGPADDAGTSIPPVIDKASFERVREYIRIGKEEATCALEVNVQKLIDETDGGYYVGPTIFTDVAADAKIAQDEIFGPVLCILRARSFDQAIGIFNATDYALTGGVYSRSPAHIEQARRECECGSLYINRKITGSRVDLQPFGGFRMSGTGTKAGGPDYLIQYCIPRTVTENTLRRGFAPSEDVLEKIG